MATQTFFPPREAKARGVTDEVFQWIVATNRREVEAYGLTRPLFQVRLNRDFDDGGQGGCEVSYRGFNFRIGITAEEGGGVKGMLGGYAVDDDECRLLLRREDCTTAQEVCAALDMLPTAVDASDRYMECHAIAVSHGTAIAAERCSGSPATARAEEFAAVYNEVLGAALLRHVSDLLQAFLVKGLPIRRTLTTACGGGVYVPGNGWVEDAVVLTARQLEAGCCGGYDDGEGLCPGWEWRGCWPSPVFSSDGLNTGGEQEQRALLDTLRNKYCDECVGLILFSARLGLHGRLMAYLWGMVDNNNTTAGMGTKHPLPEAAMLSVRNEAPVCLSRAEQELEEAAVDACCRDARHMLLDALVWARYFPECACY